MGGNDWSSARRQFVNDRNIEITVNTHRQGPRNRGGQVNKGDRIAQLILEKCDTPAVVEIGLLEETERGSKGFGSTGVSE